MSTDPDCIFCKIIAGEIPSFKLYEDAQSFAFMDINPASAGHALVIPKLHAENIHAIAQASLNATMATVKRVAGAVEAALSPDGINIVQANGPGAAQSVFHFHVHVLPRTNGDGLKLNWGLAPGDMDAIGNTAQRIRAHL